MRVARIVAEIVLETPRPSPVTTHHTTPFSMEDSILAAKALRMIHRSP